MLPFKYFLGITDQSFLYIQTETSWFGKLKIDHLGRAFSQIFM